MDTANTKDPWQSARLPEKEGVTSISEFISAGAFDTGVSTGSAAPPAAPVRDAANREGQWRNAALAPPALDYRQEGPLLPGVRMCAPPTTMGSDRHHRHNHHGSVATCDDGDGCRILFTSANPQISPAELTVTRCRAPASTSVCPAGRAARARRRCDRGARGRRRCTGSVSVARRARRAS